MASDFDEIFGDLVTEPFTAGEELNPTALARKLHEERNEQPTHTSDPGTFLSWLDDDPPVVPSAARSTLVAPLPMTISHDKYSKSEEDPFEDSAVKSEAQYTAEESNLIALSEEEVDDPDLDQVLRNVMKDSATALSSRISSQARLPVRTHSQMSEMASNSSDAAVYRQFKSTGEFAAESRVQLWKEALAERINWKLAIQMAEVRETALDLENQVELRKDIESVCSNVFAATYYKQTVHVSCDDENDSTRLVFIDNAEILITFVCQHLRMAYTSNISRLLAPLLVVSGVDPLQYDIVVIATLLIPCLFPHLQKDVDVNAVAEIKRPLLHRLLLYHYPVVAYDLAAKYKTWFMRNEAIPSEWIASLFESDLLKLDVVVKIWDTIILIKTPSWVADGQHDFGIIIMSFIVIYIIGRAERKLIRMEQDQLRHCMNSTLVEELVGSVQTLRSNVQNICDSTPHSYSMKLYKASTAALQPTSQKVNEPNAAKAGDGFLDAYFNPLTILSATATGVRGLQHMMTDMSSKLLSIVPTKQFHSRDDGTFILSNGAMAQLGEISASASIAMVVSAEEVVYQVFKSLQPSDDSTGTQHRKSIRFFIIDCREDVQKLEGTIPTAFHIDPDSLVDTCSIEKVQAALRPMQNCMHFCVMGHGYNQIAAGISAAHHPADDNNFLGLLSPTKDTGSPYTINEDFFAQYTKDATRVHATVLFLTEQGFQHVSVLDGGYAAVHSILDTSDELAVADLDNHDSLSCSLCHHSSSISQQKSNIHPKLQLPAKFTNDNARNGEGGKPAQDVKTLFSPHTAANTSYLSNFKSVLKYGAKAPVNSGLMKDSNLNSTSSSGTELKSSGSGTPAEAVASPAGGFTNLNKWKTSLSQIGADLFKKDQNQSSGGVASPTKNRFAFGSIVTSPNIIAKSSPTIAMQSTSEHGDHGATQDTFTIDDDEEDGDGDGIETRTDSWRTSSASSTSLRGDSFEHAERHELHDIQSGRFGHLQKKWRVSRTQMLPFVQSPFFSGYKKKYLAPKASKMVPRFLVIAEEHIVVLKAEQNSDDVFALKSSHSLGHISRMTCLKKNALTVTIYYKYKRAENAQVFEKKNVYEIHQRDEFIRAIRQAMETFV